MEGNKMTKQYKDISANIGKTYDNLCQLIGENYTGNPEQLLRFRYKDNVALDIQPYKGIYRWFYALEDFKSLNELSFKAPCTLLEDITPQPKNPNLIETVEDLYERVKEAHSGGKTLKVRYERGNGSWFNLLLVDGSDNEVVFSCLLKIETAIKLGFKVEVVE